MFVMLVLLEVLDGEKFLGHHTSALLLPSDRLNVARSRAASGEIGCIPISHRVTVFLETPSSWARRACDQPRRARRAFRCALVILFRVARKWIFVSKFECKLIHVDPPFLLYPILYQSILFSKMACCDFKREANRQTMARLARRNIGAVFRVLHPIVVAR